MKHHAYESGPISEIDQFVIIGNSNRKGLPKAAQELAEFIKIETNKDVEIVESGQSVNESVDRLTDRGIAEVPSAIVILGGDGTINHTLEATRIIGNPGVYNIITDYYGGARDISYNIKKQTPRKYPQLLEYNLSGLQEASLYPIEIEINENTELVAYNVFSIGRTALMAEQINKIRNKTRGPRPYRIARETLSIIDAKLLSIPSFKAKEHNDNSDYLHIQDLIAAKSERFGLIFKSDINILNREFGVYEFDEISAGIVARLASQRKFKPDFIARNDQVIDYTVIGENLSIQTDGEVDRLSEKENVIRFKNADKPAKILIAT